MIISPDHPALAGHFPGAPVVPGVVLLDEILSAANNAAAGSPAGINIAWVKFHAPLRPGEEFVARLEPLGAASFKFTVRSGETLIASGNFKLE
jgi:3-hydroxymyristoyl/3-hydroxydecanoyl-(acyl carrier protein) dehydratase